MINIFSIALSLQRMLKADLFDKFVIYLWLIFCFLWAYYRFFAYILVFFGIDSFAFIDQMLFGNDYQQSMDETDPDIVRDLSSPIGYNLYYINDLLRLIVDLFSYLAMLMTLLIITKIMKNKSEAGLEK